MRFAHAAHHARPFFSYDAFDPLVHAQLIGNFDLLAQFLDRLQRALGEREQDLGAQRFDGVPDGALCDPPLLMFVPEAEA